MFSDYLIEQLKLIYSDVPCVSPEGVDLDGSKSLASGHFKLDN